MEKIPENKDDEVKDKALPDINPGEDKNNTEHSDNLTVEESDIEELHLLEDEPIKDNTEPIANMAEDSYVNKSPHSMNAKKAVFIFALPFIVLVLVAAGIIYTIIGNRAVNGDAETAPTKSITDSSNASESTTVEYMPDMSMYAAPEHGVDFAELKAINEDIYAWIWIPDTKIDFAILRHPDDNTYYLNHNTNGSYYAGGAVYTENYNSMDFTDAMTVIYAHIMPDGSQFTTLRNFDDRAYFDEHRYIYIYTQDKSFSYEIIGAFPFVNWHVLLNFGYDTEAGYDFSAFYDKVYSSYANLGNFLDGFEVNPEKDKILTLGTCYEEDTENMRYLVQGKLLYAKDLANDLSD